MPSRMKRRRSAHARAFGAEHRTAAANLERAVRDRAAVVERRRHIVASRSGAAQ